MKCFFLGAIKDVNRKLHDMDMFVFSTTKNEGFGIALVEAMGKGIPIIASNVGACAEVLLNGKCGMLFDPKSPNSISKSVEKALRNKDSTFKRTITAYNHAKTNFNKKKMANLYYKAITNTK